MSFDLFKERVQELGYFLLIYQKLSLIYRQFLLIFSNFGHEPSLRILPSYFQLINLMKAHSIW